MIPSRIYMVGIGGIGMSALAQFLKHEGKTVSGYDRDDSPVVDMLRKKGIEVSVAIEGIPEGTEMIIYSDAIPTTNPDRLDAQAAGIPELSYFEALGVISKGHRLIAVAGTHGKTTTTGMLAKILQDAGEEPTAIVGSIVRDFDSNFLAGRRHAKAGSGLAEAGRRHADPRYAEGSGEARAGSGLAEAGKPDLFVIEACEYRDHLLKLSPEILVITNIELDHTDYFPDLAALQNTFRIATEKVPAHGAVITNPSDPIIAAVIQNVSARIIDYTHEEVPELGLIGEFNRMNARAASAAARAAFPDIKQGSIDRALSDFKGSWRRFEYKGETPNGATVYDDYAHHPTAVAKTIEAARAKFPNKKIVVAFHPHLYSRTKSLLHEFAEALATADEALVAPIYAAREEPDPFITHHVLAREAADRGGDVTAFDSFDQIRDELLKFGSESLIITMGAGDIYKVAEQIAD